MENGVVLGTMRRMKKVEQTERLVILIVKMFVSFDLLSKIIKFSPFEMDNSDDKQNTDQWSENSD